MLTVRKFKKWHFEGDAKEFEKKNGVGSIYSEKVLKQHRDYIERKKRMSENL